MQKYLNPKEKNTYDRLDDAEEKELLFESGTEDRVNIACDIQPRNLFDQSSKESEIFLGRN